MHLLTTASINNFLAHVILRLHGHMQGEIFVTSGSKNAGVPLTRT